MINYFGQVLFNYLISLYEENINFKLAIDDYTFSKCAQMSRFEESKIIEEIIKKNTTFSNEFEALAIAAFQVKIAGDLDLTRVQTTGRDSYYQKIRDNYPHFKNVVTEAEIMNGYFKNSQIELWQTVKKLFKKKNRNLLIPKDHSGAGRYVQYPIKSRDITNSELLKWADTFIKQGLLPNQIDINFSKFSEIFFTYSETDMLKRTVFNFYAIWDGRSYKEIVNGSFKNYSKQQFHTNSISTVFIIEEDSIVFLDKESGKEVKDFDVIRNLLFCDSHKIYFTLSDNADIYEIGKGNIKENLEFVILTTDEMNFHDSILTFSTTKSIDDQNQIHVYSLVATKETANQLNLELIGATRIALVGGIKNKNGHYWIFSLPVVVFAEPQTKVYIDLEELTLNDTHLNLNEYIHKAGEHTIKIPDHIPLTIVIEKMKTLYDNDLTTIGWDYSDVILTPIPKYLEESNDKSIIGFSANIDFTLLNKAFTPKKGRQFLERIKQYDNRFYISPLTKWYKRGINE